MLDLHKLFTDLFDPQPGETALVIVDTPHGTVHDTPAWEQRRAMAERWRDALQQVGEQRGFAVAPLVSFPATGAHNAQLPEQGTQQGRPVQLEALAAPATLVL